MKMGSLLNPPPLFVAIGPDRLCARHGQEEMELVLERGADGRPTAPAKEKAIADLRQFLKARSWLPRARAWCAISTRGVSLRRLSLPGGNGEEFQHRLRLQIENEFPLPPEELAWGSQPLTQPPRPNGAGARQDYLVAAVRKELLADYHEILRACGAEPVFVLAAQARWQVCGCPAGSLAMLDVGLHQSELTVFEHGAPIRSRILFWDGRQASQPAEAPLASLAAAIRDNVAGLPLLVSGLGAAQDFPDRLARALSNGCRCELAKATPADPHPALAGLQKLAEQRQLPALQLHLEPGRGTTPNWAVVEWKKWGLRIGTLAAALLLLPYVEALLLKPHLEKKVAAFKTEANRLQVIDRELDFLEHLKVSQPPYVDVLCVLAQSAPPGTRFDSLSLNSHGEVALRTAFHDGQQVADFRNQLIASGFFTNVVVEEQVPTPDRQKVNVRLSAQESSLAQLIQASARLGLTMTNNSAPSAGIGGPPPRPLAPPAGLPIARKEPQ
jgi:hypothetical protein